MKSILSSLFALAYLSMLTAQDRHDFTWVIGYKPAAPSTQYGGNYFDFKDGSPKTSPFEMLFDTDSYTFMGDGDGNLQFYSNNCRIANKLNLTMDNGEGISPGDIHDVYCNTFSGSYLVFDGLISLPYPGHPNQYVMFHERYGITLASQPVDVLYTVIDMDANNGLGKVTQKNLPVLTDTLDWQIKAVRHANGRDWWLTVPKRNANVYFTFLLDPTGVHGPIEQQISSPWFTNHVGHTKCLFSPDGTRFMRVGGSNPALVWLYDFDRCTGTFWNERTLSLQDSLLYVAGAAFSADSRFLYITNRGSELHQFDLEANDVQVSLTKIGQYDGFIGMFGQSTSLHSMALGPDGRIYMCPLGGGWLLHTIHHPEKAGLACDFRQHDLSVEHSVGRYMPNLPNYRLYNIVGSPCDTLGVVPPMSAYWRNEQDSLSSPLEMDFVDMSYYQPVSWYWDFGDGSSSAESAPEHVFPAPGIYSVCLTACNAAGECNTLCRDVEVKTVGTSLPVPSGTLAVNVHPNPAQAMLWVAHDDLEKGSYFLLFNATGSMVRRENLPQGSGVEGVWVADLPDGLYFWQMLAHGNSGFGGKVVVKH